MISQLTVFLANEKGRLAAACRTLADADINMKALFIADTADFGIVRIFCDTPKRAVEVLGQAGFRASLTPVIAVSVEDAPGTLADLLGFCQGASMNIEYGYCFCTADGKAVDVLKIDMRFLDRDDRRSKDIMESVIRMARWLDLPVIAEGVETREQVNFLLDVGCSYAQGYYYARPMEAAAFEALLTDGSKVQHEQCALQDARRPILDFRDLLHENTISDRMLSSIIGSVALYSYADGDLRLIRGNEAYRRLIATLGEGVNGAEEGGSLLPFVHDEDRDALVAAMGEWYGRCLKESGLYDGVEVVVRRMGTNGCHWHKMRLFHLNTTNGSATVYGSVTDVTERMEYMEALRKSEQRFEMTLEASGTVVFELDRSLFGVLAAGVRLGRDRGERPGGVHRAGDGCRGVHRGFSRHLPRPLRRRASHVGGCARHHGRRVACVEPRDASGHAERGGRARQGRRPRGKRHARDGDGSFAEASRSFRARLRITPSARRARTVS